MARFEVGFEGRWHKAFTDASDALAWAAEVGETGRLVWVIHRRWVHRPKLLAVFPPERAVEGERAWRNQTFKVGPVGLG
jgi:hypothetical protein